MGEEPVISMRFRTYLRNKPGISCQNTHSELGLETRFAVFITNQADMCELQLHNLKSSFEAQNINSLI